MKPGTLQCCRVKMFLFVFLSVTMLVLHWPYSHVFTHTFQNPLHLNFHLLYPNHVPLLFCISCVLWAQSVISSHSYVVMTEMFRANGSILRQRYLLFAFSFHWNCLQCLLYRFLSFIVGYLIEEGPNDHNQQLLTIVMIDR